MYGLRQRSNRFLWHVEIQFPQHHLLKRLFFPYCVFQEPLSKINLLYMHEFISGISFCSICLYVYLLIPCCFDYCHFVISFGINLCDISSLVLVPPCCFGYSESSLVLYVTLGLFSLFLFKKFHWDFDENCIESVHLFGQYKHFNNFLISLSF